MNDTVDELKRVLGKMELDRLFQDLLANWTIAKQDPAITGLTQPPNIVTPQMAFDFLLKELDKKIRRQGYLWVISVQVELEANPCETCDATIRGVPQSLVIAGKTRFVGTVLFKNGKGPPLKIYQRFIGKTFYQYVVNKA